MALIAARKTMTIAHNVENILVIELLAACQAIDLSQNGCEPGKGSKAVYDVIREKVPKMDHDREFRLDIDACRMLVQSEELVQKAEHIVGTINLR